MRKINLVLVFTFLVLFEVFSQDNIVDTGSLVKVFPVGTGDGELMYAPFGGGGSAGPTAFCFDKEGKFYITDPRNYRFCIFNKDYELIKIIAPTPIMSPRSINVDEHGNIIGYRGGYGIEMMDSSGKEAFDIYLSGNIKEEVDHYKDFFIDGDLVIAYKKDGGLIGYKNPGLDYEENNRNVMDTDAVIREIQQNHPALRVERETTVLRQSTSRSGVPQRNNSSDGGYQIFQNGELLSRDIEDFEQSKGLNYGELSMSRTSSSGTIDIYQLLEKNLKKSKKHLLGTDSDGNSYWQIHLTYFVFNSSGIPVAAFELKPEFLTAGPAITLAGDFYYMHSDNTGHYLYKIERDW